MSVCGDEIKIRFITSSGTLISYVDEFSGQKQSLITVRLMIILVNRDVLIVHYKTALT